MASKRVCILIGSDRYNYMPHDLLMSPQSAVAALGDILARPEIGGFEVKILFNEHSQTVTRNVSQWVRDLEDDDFLLVYFVGYSEVEHDDLFLFTSDTEPDDLILTALAARTLVHIMDSCRSRIQVLLLDCDYGGHYPIGPSVASRYASRVGRVLIAASDAWTLVFDRDVRRDDGKVQLSFTNALVKGNPKRRGRFG